MRPMKLVPDNTNIRFLRWRWVALAVSVLLLLGSLATVSTKGLNWGVDFVGGQQMRVTFAQPVNLGELRGRLGGMKAEFDADLHALRRITYTGVTFRTRTPDEVAAINEAMVADLWPLLSERRFTMPIDSAFELADFADALSRMRANAHFGKIVLRH